MVSITSEYGLYLYTGKVDMRKGIDGLCGIISDELGHNPRKPKSVCYWLGYEWWPDYCLDCRYGGGTNKRPPEWPI